MKEASKMKRTFTDLFLECDRIAVKIEQFWYDDPLHTRHRHKEAAEKLLKFSAEEFFKFRNYRIPPPMLGSIYIIYFIYYIYLYLYILLIIYICIYIFY